MEEEFSTRNSSLCENMDQHSLLSSMGDNGTSGSGNTTTSDESIRASKNRSTSMNTMSATDTNTNKNINSKRNQKELTLPEKVRLIQKASRGHLTHSKLAKQFGISSATVSRILKRREEYLSMAKEDTTGVRKRKFRNDGNNELNSLVLQWYEDRRLLNHPVNGPMLREQALYFAKMLKLNDFKASNGWLDSFRVRHNIYVRAQTNEYPGKFDSCVGERDGVRKPAFSSIYEPASESGNLPSKEPPMRKYSDLESTVSQLLKIVKRQEIVLNELLNSQRDAMQRGEELLRKQSDMFLSRVDVMNQRYNHILKLLNQNSDSSSEGNEVNGNNSGANEDKTMKIII